MRSEWQEKSLGELVSLQRGYDLPSQKRVTGDVPVAGSAGISGFHNQSNVQGPGIVIGRSGVGSMGVVSFIDRDFWALNTTLFVKDFKGNDQRFIYYLLKTINFRQFDTGSAQASLNRNLIYPYRVIVPVVVKEQRALASVLWALERRIDLLHQTNTALESIAQALFKSWFIDFDPVRAKAEGREPDGMDADTAALFPAEFEESALGLIPKGWRQGVLGDVCSNPRSQAKPGQVASETPYIGLEHMPRKSISLADAGTAEGLASGKFWFERNDILFGKLRPYFHKVGLAPCQGICSTDILVIRPKSEHFLGFVAMHAFSEELIAHATQLSNGARMPRTSWHDIEKYKVVLPGEQIAAAFDQLLRPLFGRIFANIESARTLANLRDTLLPRLISGKLRLPEAEAQVEAAAA